MLSEATVPSQAETDVSLAATRWAWAKSAHKGNTILVLLALADHAYGRKGRPGRPSRP